MNRRAGSKGTLGVYETFYQQIAPTTSLHNTAASKSYQHKSHPTILLNRKGPQEAELSTDMADPDLFKPKPLLQPLTLKFSQPPLFASPPPFERRPAPQILSAPSPLLSASPSFLNPGLLLIFCQPLLFLQLPFLSLGLKFS